VIDVMIFNGILAMFCLGVWICCRRYFDLLCHLVWILLQIWLEYIVLDLV